MNRKELSIPPVKLSSNVISLYIIVFFLSFFIFLKIFAIYNHYYQTFTLLLLKSLEINNYVCLYTYFVLTQMLMKNTKKKKEEMKKKLHIIIIK